MRLSKGFLGFFFFTLVIAMKVEDHLVDISQIIHQVPTSHKVVALTFDDGPLAESTSEILSILKEKNIKATFFVVGEQVEKFPKLVQQEIAEGHEVGSHTYSHPTLINLRKNAIEQELDKTEQAILKVAPKPTLFRPPGGLYNDLILKIARDNGYLTILWSVDPYDWRYPPVGKIVNVILKDSKPGSIILLHDGKYPSSTPEALGFIIDSLKARGYEFVTVSELLQYYEAKP
ncbi:polysaccharide deacetylase family protein [Pelosinus sp. sgz500959]|uniref:polysaccharide deacetylase family protein n=1 Tax=Pelosinus sp. sgz500959 TaxID=3242472 RepID=UPI00367298F4